MKTKFTEYIILKELIEEKRKSDVLKITPSFSIANNEEAVVFLEMLEKLFRSLNTISDKGFINNSSINIPLVISLLTELKIIKDPSKFYGSIVLNVIFYNLILLLIYKMVLMIEDSVLNLNDKNSDIIIDIKVFKKEVLRMINPCIIKKLSNNGLTVLLNTFTGFDSEYELKSSLKKTNDLLSIQLASTTNISLKIPVINKDPISVNDFNIINNAYGWVEKGRIDLGLRSIDYLIKDIRFFKNNDYDNFINDLTDYMNDLSEYMNMNSSENIKLIKHQDFSLYVFPKTSVVTKIKYLNEYYYEDLIIDSESLNNDEHEKSLLSLIQILNIVTRNQDNISDRMKKSLIQSVNKPNSRITYRFNNSLSKINITINRTLYLCMHESAADFSILKNFDILKEQLDIIDRSYVTRSKPLIFDFCKSKVHFRDTILIAPAAAKSLASIGEIYGEEFKKIDIGKYRNGNMRLLMEENKRLFELYAIRDSIITLKHAVSMEEYFLTVNRIGVPLTISGISRAYVETEWSRIGYKGYQVREDIHIGNIIAKLTPKNARSIDLSNYIIPFIAGFRGGRNESMMFGLDLIENESRSWFDVDLTSAYPTVMSILGQPNYDKAARLYNKTVLNMSTQELILNYVVLKVDFEFPKDTKYPCIPTRVDDDIDIYPLKGSSIITGSEYLVAKSMGCKLYVNEGVIIPFMKNSKIKSKNMEWTKDIKDLVNYPTPFREIMKELQRKRREFPKKTFYNYLYKLIANAIFGLVSMGISGKKSFDIISKSHVRVEGGFLSNPILSSYITGFSRALIGECINNVHKLGGKVVSVTTDGFITNLEDLENKILSMEDNNNKNCLLLYREMRKILTTFDNKEEFDNRGLEIKNIESKGLLSWKTRGQLGLTEGGISAMTGFQSRFLDREFLVNYLIHLFQNKRYHFEFVQSGLRSALDIYKHGGHMIQKYSDRTLSILYDNRRCIIENESSENKGVGFYDSKAWNSISEYARIRTLKSLVKTPIFTGYTTQVSKAYKSYIDTGVRAFIKSCLTDLDECRYGIPKNYFSSYKALINFIELYKPAKELKLNASKISMLRNRRTISRAVPRTKENESFIEYIKLTFPNFESDRFFREFSSDYRKRQRIISDGNKVNKKDINENISVNKQLILYKPNKQLIIYV